MSRPGLLLRPRHTPHTLQTHAGLMFDKPFADVKRSRFEGARAKLGGHTGRIGCSCRRCWESNEPEIKRSHAPKVGGDQYEYLDLTDAYGKRSFRITEPYLLTDFEAEGLDTIYSLQRAIAWKAVPETLCQLSVAPPSVKNTSDGKVHTTYLLQATGAFLPSSAVASAFRDLTQKIYTFEGRSTSRQKLTLWKELALEPPATVEGELLKATLRCTGMNVPQSAVVRCNENMSFWHVAKAHGKPLEIDLGQTCVISNFSTQGNHPPTRIFPEKYRDKSGILRVESKELLRGVTVDHAGNERYIGPHYSVRCTEDHFGHPCQYRQLKLLQPMFVTRYELQWRAENGRKWHSLGIFRGNHDQTTEVSHSFAMMKGLSARYLRVIPIEWEDEGAMRVGVYGWPANKTTQSKRGKPSLPGKAEADEESHLISYTLTDAKASKFVPDGRSLVKDTYNLRTSTSKRSERRAKIKQELQDYYRDD
ncbi:MAG: hypothetical protein SGPRY_010607 [Prymnesium sp.]